MPARVDNMDGAEMESRLGSPRRVFEDYKTLMVEVEQTAASLAIQIREAVNEIRHRSKGDVVLGTLHFAGSTALDSTTNPATVSVVYSPGWGLKYTTAGGDIRPNNNGSIMDLLRNSSPHGLPVQGSWFKRSEET